MCMPQTLTNAVMDVDYSPTGLEFVAGGFDQSLRIFRAAEGRSRYGNIIGAKHNIVPARCTTPSACSASSASNGRPTPNLCCLAATKPTSGRVHTNRSTHVIVCRVSGCGRRLHGRSWAPSQHGSCARKTTRKSSRSASSTTPRSVALHSACARHHLTHSLMNVG